MKIKVKTPRGNFEGILFNNKKEATEKEYGYWCTEKDKNTDKYMDIYLKHNKENINHVEFGFTKNKIMNEKTEK